MPAALLLAVVCVIGAGARGAAGVHAAQLADPAGGRRCTCSSRSAARSTARCCSASSSRPTSRRARSPFIQHNIDATRRAFALDRVEERELSGDALLTRADIARNAATLENVRLWDHQPLLDTFGQIQEIRTYYDFVSVDNDRYRIDGALRQVMLSARELNSASLPNRTWVNERLTFTHGYGLTLGPVNQVTSEGLPVLFVAQPAAGDDRRSCRSRSRASTSASCRTTT